MVGVIRSQGATPVAIGGTRDHIHILAGLSSSVAVANLVREIKKSSSAWAGSRNPKFGWQKGYVAFSVGRSELEAVRQYILSQEDHHREFGSQEELRRFLEEMGCQIIEEHFE